MRHAVVLAAVAAAMSLVAPDARAYDEGPWCAVQSIGNGSVTENCRMTTFEQCRMEVIAGNRGFCKPNARWHASAEIAHERRPHRKHRARHR
jgi:hypothetical protein